MRLCPLTSDTDVFCPALEDSVLRIVTQLFTYMAMTGVAFGWLSCWYATWLVHRPTEKVMLVSRPFLHDSAGPGVTVMGALSWLQEQSFAWHAAGARLAPWQQTASGGGEEEAGDEDTDSSLDDAQKEYPDPEDKDFEPRHGKRCEQSHIFFRVGLTYLLVETCIKAGVTR
jgi:hypothetical protein